MIDSSSSSLAIHTQDFGLWVLGVCVYNKQQTQSLSGVFTRLTPYGKRKVSPTLSDNLKTINPTMNTSINVIRADAEEAIRYYVTHHLKTGDLEAVPELKQYLKVTNASTNHNLNCKEKRRINKYQDTTMIRNN